MVLVVLLNCFIVEMPLILFGLFNKDSQVKEHSPSAMEGQRHNVPGGYKSQLQKKDSEKYIDDEKHGEINVDACFAYAAK